MSRELFLSALAATTIIPAAAAAFVDWRVHRVPTSLVIVMLAPLALAVAVADEPIGRLVAMSFGAGAMALPLLLIHLVSPAAMGFGDVKLALPVGAAVGLIAPVLALTALAVGAGLTLVMACWNRRAGVPFAPGLVAGAVAALVVGSLEGWKVPV